MHKKAKKRGFDVDQYNNLKRQLAEVEHDLRRLRDPLYIRYAPTTPPSNFPDPNAAAQNLLANDSKSRIASILESAAKKFQK